MVKKKVIDGNCPYCGEKNSVRLTDYCYVRENTPFAKDVPLCSNCGNDEIELRKINNRRYKILGKW